jgi:dihydropteroate synthase
MNTLLPWGTRTFVMGILNVTPDSFSGDGLLDANDSVPACLVKARQFAKDGVDILDVGAESTRPGARSIPLEEELRRILPVARALVAEGLTTSDGRRILLSVDTYKSTVAEAALNVGFDWINDVWGLRADVAMAEVAARYGAGLVLMDNRSRPENVDFQVQLGGRYTGQAYGALMDEVQADLIESVKLARSAGVQDTQIILDPGIGFGKTVEQNLDLINRLDVIRALNFPVLLGPSRKGFIGYTLNLPKEDRLEGTAAAVAVGIARGADIIRVHDVGAMVRVARMTDAIVRRSNAR